MQQAETLTQPSVEPPPTVDTQSIVLPDYRRAANSTHTCVFPICNSTSFHGVSDKLRAIVLHNHHYYLPKLARVCSQHLSSNSWDTLYSSDNSLETFSVDQIQHVFSMVNAFNPSLDFDNIDDMDERVFEYWIGLTKEKFNILIWGSPTYLPIEKRTLKPSCFSIKNENGRFRCEDFHIGASAASNFRKYDGQCEGDFMSRFCTKTRWYRAFKS